MERGDREVEEREGGGGKDIPSSFPRTLFTAPEQPPQDMLTLNLYVWSAIFASFCISLSGLLAVWGWWGIEVAEIRKFVRFVNRNRKFVR